MIKAIAIILTLFNLLCAVMNFRLKSYRTAVASTVGTIVMVALSVYFWERL